MKAWLCLALLAGCAHPEKCALRLPFQSGEARLVIQGNDGAFSHTGRYRYAWDFRMPVGTAVTAAANGVVAEVIDQFAEGRPDHALDERANLVVIDHGGARFSVYQHLSPGGALVAEGETVTRGEPIARSGNSGFTSEPHLHFAVIDHRNRSQPACFANVAGDGVPRQGQLVRPRAIVLPPSTLPRDTFSENGIALESDVPARRFTAPLTLRGRATRSARRVVAVFLPRARDGRKQTFFGDLDAEARFSIAVDPAALAELGPALDFVLALEAADGTYRFDFSVPVVVRALPAGGGSSSAPTTRSR